jgi:hypothetical protein
MLRISILLLVTLLGLACKEKYKKSGQHEERATAAGDSVKEITQQQPVNDTAKSQNTFNGDSSVITKKWKDKSTFKMLRVINKEAGTMGEGNYREWLTARTYTSNDSIAWEKIWDLQDSTRGSGQTFIIEKNGIILKDFDGDGLQDIYFYYALMNVEGADPDVLRFVIVTNNNSQIYKCRIDQETKEANQPLLNDLFNQNADLKNVKESYKILMKKSIIQFLEYRRKNVEG